MWIVNWDNWLKKYSVLHILAEGSDSCAHFSSGGPWSRLTKQRERILKVIEVWLFQQTNTTDQIYAKKFYPYVLYHTDNAEDNDKDNDMDYDSDKHKDIYKDKGKDYWSNFCQIHTLSHRAGWSPPSQWKQKSRKTRNLSSVDCQCQLPLTTILNPNSVFSSLVFSSSKPFFLCQGCND